ncbi:MAG TPA: oligosaccharide flippase family protein [Actinomycetota bacterium]
MTPARPEPGLRRARQGAGGTTGAAGVARTRRGSVAGLSGATLLPALLGALTGPLAARALAPAGRGQAAAVTAFALFLPVVASLGVPVAIGQRAATHPVMRPRLVAAAIRFALATVPVTLLASVGIMAGPLRSIGGSARVVAAMTLGTTPLVVLGLCLQQLLLAEGALGAYARVRAVPLVVNAALTVALFVAGRLTVATYLGTTLAANVTAITVALRFVGARPGRWEGAHPLRPLVHFGLRGFVGTLASMTNARLDQMVIVPLLGSRPLGLYAVSVSVASLPQGIGQAITARSFGEVASSRDRTAEAARYLRLTTLVVGGACCTLAAVAPFAIPVVYGEPFRGSVAPLLLLLPGTVALALVFAMSSTLQVLGRPGLPSWAELAGVLVTAGGLAALLSPMGIAGAALVSTASYGTTLAVNIVFLRRIGVRGLVPRAGDLQWVLSRMARAAGVRKSVR